MSKSDFSAADEARELLRKALETTSPPEAPQPSISVHLEAAGNVAHSIHIEQQTLHLGRN